MLVSVLLLTDEMLPQYTRLLLMVADRGTQNACLTMPNHRHLYPIQAYLSAPQPASSTQDNSNTDACGGEHQQRLSFIGSLPLVRTQSDAPAGADPPGSTPHTHYVRNTCLWAMKICHSFCRRFSTGSDTYRVVWGGGEEEEIQENHL